MKRSGKRVDLTGAHIEEGVILCCAKQKTAFKILREKLWFYNRQRKSAGGFARVSNKRAAKNWSARLPLNLELLKK